MLLARPLDRAAADDPLRVGEEHHLEQHRRRIRRGARRVVLKPRVEVREIELVIEQVVQRHRAADALPTEPDLAAKAAQRITQLERDASQLRDWLAVHPTDRRGPTGGIRKSNRTDNESAKMATSKGVIQGYTGVAAVDAQHQIIVEAQAHGTGAEQELLLPVVEAMHAMLTPTSLVTADAGYHSAANLQQLATLGVEALIADPAMRTRDAHARCADGPRSTRNGSSTAWCTTSKSSPARATRRSETAGALVHHAPPAIPRPLAASHHPPRDLFGVSHK